MPEMSKRFRHRMFLHMTLSSSKTMSADSLATSLPLKPMAMPMCASFRAGASFTPSPVTATISPLPPSFLAASRARLSRTICGRLLPSWSHPHYQAARLYEGMGKFDAALREGREGTTAFRVTVDETGKVVGRGDAHAAAVGSGVGEGDGFGDFTE